MNHTTRADFESAIERIILSTEERLASDEAKAAKLAELREVFADWLDEHGEADAAIAQRWQGRMGKWPATGLTIRNWVWKYPTVDNRGPSSLPPPVHEHGSGTKSTPWRYPIRATLAEAEADLAAEIARVRREPLLCECGRMLRKSKNYGHSEARYEPWCDRCERWQSEPWSNIEERIAAVERQLWGIECESGSSSKVEPSSGSHAAAAKSSG